MSEKIYLGFNLGFNASAAIVSNERGLLAAVSQERLNGIKGTKEIPLCAMAACCKEAGVDRVDFVAYSHYQGLTDKELLRDVGGSEENKKIIKAQMARPIEPPKKLLEAIRSKLGQNGVRVKTSHIVRIEHHSAHESSSFAFYGKPLKFVSVTSDGFGDGVSGRIKYYDGRLFCVLSEVSLMHSPALVYQFVTGALGFREHHHEGKITGLAAFGKPSYYGHMLHCLTGRSTLCAPSVYSNGFCPSNETLLELDEEEQEAVKASTIEDFDWFLRLKKSVYKWVKDTLADGWCENIPEMLKTVDKEDARWKAVADIAATVQKFAQDVTVGWINATVSEFKKPKESPVCHLSGGLFANVKINQHIRETGLFSDVRVVPPMGDEGTAVGSAWHLMAIHNSNDQNAPKVMHQSKIYDRVACGTSMVSSMEEYMADEFVRAKMFSRGDIKAMYFDADDYDGLLEEVVDKLANKKIVCWCQGRMEFGPRALCHRTILYDCTDPSTNDWLNKQLGRTEFMPFAPVTRDYDAHLLFKGWSNKHIASKFMTITYDCTDEFKDKYPAATHVDGTARPQVVSKDDEPMIYELLTRYELKTGLQVLINTSFNLHNNPIIESAEMAIDSWLKSNTDVLVIGTAVFERVK